MIKKCYKCSSEKPATLEFFHSDSSRPDGLCYKCKECCKGRKDKRKHRWLNSSEEQKNVMREKQIIYRRTMKGKIIDILSSYKTYDKSKGYENDLTKEFLESVLTSNCYYCGDTSTGCDRKDNKKGHTIENCVPCCKTCNIGRMDNFTHEEMIELGATIKIIKQRRNGTKYQFH